MFAAVISDKKHNGFYKRKLRGLDIDFSKVIYPEELKPSSAEIFNNYYLKKAEMVLVLTQNDEYNFYIAKLCKKNYGISNVITLLNNSNNKSIFNSIGVEKIIESDEYGKEEMFMYMVRNN